MDFDVSKLVWTRAPQHFVITIFATTMRRCSK